MGLRTYLRRELPPPARMCVARIRRWLSDLASGDRLRFVVRAKPDIGPDWIARVSVRQKIFKTERSAGKVFNLRLASTYFDGLVCPPGALLSFWSILGAPSPERGFREGRAIRENQLAPEFGGGLCQLSGLLYELGLRAGLAVRERHPHSHDLYTEATRFTPLGLDATVVWGYKDLRLAVGAHQIAFQVTVGGEWIEGRLLTRAPIALASLDVARRDAPTGSQVTVTRVTGNAREPVSQDFYARGV